MFRKERFRADVTVKKINQATQSKRTLCLLSHRGSILIGIIITMVVMGFLGAGMLYMTTSSTYNELFFGKHSDAYYTAESGGRYAMAVIRDACSNNTCGDADAINGKTFNLGNNSSFQITQYNRSHTEGVPDTFSFFSVGTVGSGFLQAKREIAYYIQPANQGGTKLPGVLLDPGMGGFQNLWGTMTQAGGALTVTTTLPESQVGNKRGWQYEYRAYSYYTLLDFSSYRTAQGGSLGYDAQVKNNITTDYFITGLAFRVHSLNAQNGDTTAAKDDPRGFNLSIIRTAGDADSEGLPRELVNDGLQTYDSTWTAGDYYLILWMDAGYNGAVDDNSAPHEYLLAYKKVDSTSGLITSFFDNMENGINGWTVTTPNGNPWALTTSSYYSASHSWDASESGNGKSTTLTSKQIDFSAATSGRLSFWYNFSSSNKGDGYVQICTGAGGTNCSTVWTINSSSGGWKQAVISVTGLTSTTSIQFVAETTSGSGTKTVDWHVDDVKLEGFTAWSTLLVRLLEKNLTPSDDSTRRNIILAYYSTPKANSTIGHVTIDDNNRLGGNPRDTFNWPDKDTSKWSTNFTLIKWDWINGCGYAPNYGSCGTSAALYTDSNDGSGHAVPKGSVVKTKYFRTRDVGVKTDGYGSFEVRSGYSELGLNVFSKNGGGNIFFDDFAVSISNGGGSNGTGTVIQYP